MSADDPITAWISELQNADHEAAEFSETCESLFRQLGDPKLQQVAAMRMEGYTDSEIAARLRCSRSTVQRRLEVIRRSWQKLAASVA